jgi:hypothetical protein
MSASIAEKSVLSMYDLTGKLVSGNPFVSEDGSQLIINIPGEVNGQFVIKY